MLGKLAELMLYLIFMHLLSKFKDTQLLISRELENILNN
jgi:hypothetical protein